MMLNEDNKKEIAKILNERISKLECPICHKGSFTIIDGYMVNQIHNKLGTFSLGGPAIPTIAIVCNNCGYISQHALGALGLLPPKATAQEDISTR